MISAHTFLSLFQLVTNRHWTWRSLRSISDQWSNSVSFSMNRPGYDWLQKLQSFKLINTTQYVDNLLVWMALAQMFVLSSQFTHAAYNLTFVWNCDCCAFCGWVAGARARVAGIIEYVACWMSPTKDSNCVITVNEHWYNRVTLIICQ